MPRRQGIPADAADFTCYGHPQTGIGIAIVAISILPGILVVFTGMLLSETRLTRRSPQVHG